VIALQAPLTGCSASKGEAVDLDDTPEQAAYRAEVHAWLERHRAEAPVLEGPDALQDEREIIAARRAWQGRLAEAGLAGVTWPKEYGGQALGPIEQVIVSQEIGRARVPGILDAIGVGMLGPTVIAHGTEEQKARHLGPLLHGDEVWCQLFSEPAAGSDLAAVQARARELDDGSWRLTGQKVWTTNAQFASYGLLLARTDPDVPKHKGLTMFIVPMDADGVTVRGLRQISGEAEFNEVFFDDVALGPESVVGPVGGGWGTALTTLMFERVTIGLGAEGMGYRSDRFARAIASDADARRDREVRRQLGEISSELLAVRFTGHRTLTALQRGQIPGPEAGLAKVTIVSAAIRAGDVIADVLGPAALDEDNEWAYMISFLPGLKSAGGTEEILRNTVGERVLGLPPEPRLDKGVPFSELRARGDGARTSEVGETSEGGRP
jgi:alkylation response protein AidB-like acyl-CoA dehydrogenase